jgi:prepilin-type processing-associated H-X9-DG protein
MRDRRGFTHTDLIALLVAAALLSGAIVIAAGTSRESAERVRCASNLRQVGQALLLYLNDGLASGSPFPATTADPTLPPTAYTGAAPGAAVAPNDVTAALFLLLKTQEIRPDVFLCPSVGTDPLPLPLTGQNFPGRAHLNYSFVNPYPGPTASGYDLAKLLRNSGGPAPEFPVAADMAPPQAGSMSVNPAANARLMRAGNSPNHARDVGGQNVLFADGHVDWMSNPFVGVDSDQIYTYGPSGPKHNNSPGLGVWGYAAHATDAVLLPPSDFGPQPPPRYMPRGAWPYEVAATLAVVAAGAWVWRRRFKRLGVGGQRRGGSVL